jgi:heme oxygenase
LPVARLLKQQTSAAHERVELARFAGWWWPEERAIDRWAHAEPSAAAALGWTRRRRSEILRSDLMRLGLTGSELAVLPEAVPVLADPGPAEVLGWLYVSEGSTLGGAIINRLLDAEAATAALRLQMFAPYPEGPGPMWRGYLAALADWTHDDAQRRDAVLTAGCTVFDALADWLEPIALRAAA